MKMNFHLLYCTFIISMTGAFAKNEKIVGGDSVNIRQYPFQVSLRKFSSNQHFCGGTIITKKHVISSGHCLDDYIYDFTDIIVSVGCNTPTAMLSKYKVLQINIHKKYTGISNFQETVINDLSIATVETMQFNQFVNKANLPTKDLITGDVVTITGYGKQSNHEIVLSSSLRHAQMHVVDNKFCSTKLNRRIHKRQACIQNEIGIGGCHGDSGGPVSIDGVIVGVLSFVVPCAQDYPDVIIKIYPYLNFINTIIIK